MSTIVIDQITNSLPTFLKENEFSKIGVLVDEHTKAFCLPIVTDLLPTHDLIIIQSGEVNKTIHTCQFIWRKLTEKAFDRKSLLINLGGGVIGDMGGFCAASFKRGISFINIPTTLLSSVDASVGGKLGIDFNGFKNHIGFFKEPDAVLIDPIFLETLPSKELRSGFAEVIKHGLIADEDYYEQIIKDGMNQPNWNAVIAHSVHIKSEVVKKDPFEEGLRKVLNFGHTIGHALESHYLSTEHHLLHGEAIAIGMICEAFLSKKLTGLSEIELKNITANLIGIYGKSKINKNDLPAIIKRMYHDKKNSHNLLNHSLIKKVGEAIYDIAVDEKDVMDALFYYEQLN
jgi:3-dehydroquinate synthase